MRPISENPFVVLGVTPRSTKQEIHDAVEDALLDAATLEDERRLDTARQSLIVPNDRLNAELSYLLEMRPADAKKAAEGQSFEHWSEVAEKTEGIAATNALTFALDASPNIENSKSLLEALLIGWAKVDVSDVTSRINEARSVAGFGSVTARDVERGVAVLRQSHGERAAASLGDDDTSADALSAFLTDTVIPSKRMNDRFADDLMQSYAKKVGGALASANDRALSGLQEFVKHGASTDFAEFEIELRSWDRLAQPLQLVSETKGADDAHSKDLYEAIRSAAIDLANQDGRFQDALDITSLATEVFAELPWAADQLREDAETLNDIIANRSREEVLLPLATALSEARNQIAFTSRQLTQHGFQASSPKPIGSIWAAYVAILSFDVDVEVRDLGASMVRGLSIALVNDHSDSLSAKAITAQLRADEGWFSSELVAQITKDELELEKNVIMGDLQDAMGREEWKEASRLCSQLIALCSAKEARDISKIQQIADQKIAERTKSRVVWGILGAAVLGFMIFQDSSSPTQPSGYGEDDSSVEMPADDVGAYGENGFSPGPEADETELEVRPEYAGGVFSLPQVRYCVRQSERIERAEAMVFSSDQRQRFNSAVSDFNLRCSSFRYDSSDMTTVRAEIFGMQDRLQSEARDIVGSATDLTVPSYTPPVTSDFGLEEPDSTESTPAAEDVEADTENPLGEPSDF